MDKWEYNVLDVNLLEDKDDWISPFKYAWQKELEEELNKMGEQGWELVQVTNQILDRTNSISCVIFKRKLFDEKTRV